MMLDIYTLTHAKYSLPPKPHPCPYSKPNIIIKEVLEENEKSSKKGQNTRPPRIDDPKFFKAFQGTKKHDLKSEFMNIFRKY